jgi:zinc/manganese transport system substrate-binding protein
MRLTFLTMAIALLTIASPAHADLKVFACEPEWGALVRELGGEKVDIYIATNGLQDPHQIQARPSLIAKARDADLTVCSGSELEVGWMPMIAHQAANAKINPGAPGAFEAARYVRMLEVPTRLDRSEGDIHPGGNPHIQTDPRNIAAVAVPLAQRMIELDPGNSGYYNARYTDFANRWIAAMAKWEAQAAALKGVPVAVQHKSWAYLFDWLGLDEVVALEPKPGIPPSSGYLAEVLDTLRHRPVKMVIRGAYEDSRPSDFIGEQAKIPEVVLPFTVGGDDQAKDLFGLFDDTIQRLLAGLGHDARKS